MRKRKLTILVLCLILLTACTCRQNAIKENNSNDIQIAKVNQAEVKTEIEKWKVQLIRNKQIGKHCNYKKFDSLTIQHWEKNNLDQIDGLPDDKKIKSVSFDFDNDNKPDLLLYFQGENCTGHNGGTKTYAKIIYSDGTSNSNLMTEIINAIQSKYNQIRETNNSLKEITTTISGYHNGITGEFSLFSKDDAHCCPSYKGSYRYKLKSKNIEIKTLKNKK